MISRDTLQEPFDSLCIVIPVRNVDRMIHKVLYDIIETVKVHKTQILLLDNESNDKTKDKVLEVFQLFEHNRNLSLHYIRNEKNLGYGGSLKKGSFYNIST
jgi:GT2 family glycosyltransferase